MLRKYRYLILRRFVQIGLLVLYVLGNYTSIKVLQGNLSSSLVFGKIPLSDPFAVLQLFFSGAIVGSTALIGAVLIALFYGILVGRAYCAYVCPINLVTDIAAFLRRKLGIDALGNKVYLSNTLRYVLLALSLGLSAIFGIAAFETISPIAMMHRGIIFGAGVGFFAVLVVFLLDLFIAKNAFCGRICPLGAFYALLGRFAILKVKYDLESCTHCLECKVICPQKQVLGLIGKHSGLVTSGECTRCGRCIEVCGDNALRFSLLEFVKEK
ncbi:quinol dehydrogenase ferredoxin subunit NapH [Helicobacter turcicus]|uniref:Quinol dehydrogenase ferredoxin subunit NapH n=1 Tax=Helicobacter turcicus TaxID=2867412 RepID=A0ABS7JNG4_9HELI|nr:quinol dehydrogenase ferredoxin subunit NapH [Helicobacter turcicus]MBX7490946.1 quinol dehydrogenase ferredoxin subunit NapH [Helicobacter turcicus]MBX7545800.1 quinol dehydrogenase ferredoxin subunit NapH [Helicobacter turcicus]